MVTKQTVKNILKKYELAWRNRDSEAIIKLFAKDGTYHERAFEKPFIGHREIKKYWENKVIGEEENITFKLLNVYVDGDIAIAEWLAEFDEVPKKCKTTIKEVAIMEIKNGKIKSFREYWHSKHN